MSDQDNRYKWFILALVVLTDVVVVAMPSMAMSVLSKEISTSLNLSLVQVGVVWGIGSLPGIVTSLLGGVIGDKFGPKKILTICTLLLALLGAARGLASSFPVLVIIVVLYGALIPFITINGMKIIGQLFPPKLLGFANGCLSMGMALGFMLGSLLSASFLSPVLGGWRNVLFLYGLIGVILFIPWVFTRTSNVVKNGTGHHVSMLNTVRHIMRNKNIWTLGFVMFGFGSCIQGILGYLPLYLRGLDWQGVMADSAVTAFHAVSLLFVLPISILSDRLGSRKKILLVTIALTMIGTGLLSVLKGDFIWAAILMIGFVRDGTMALLFTMAVETEGIGPVYAGTATGFVAAVGAIGNSIEPPVGNSLAGLWAGAPFAFWAISAFCGFILLLLIKVKTNKHLEVSPNVAAD